MGIREKLSHFGRSVVAELQVAAGEPEPRSVDDFTASVSSGDVDKHIPDRSQLERYWDLYKEVPIIRNPIRSFASEVIEPGYYVDAEDEELSEELEQWLESSCIVDGEINKDFRRLLKKATIQREVKGTSLIEKVQTESGDLYGFKLMPVEATRAYTLPGQNILVPPDADIDEENDRIFGATDRYTTEDGEMAAYVQLTTDINSWSNDYNGFVAFTRDQVVKLTRDTDTGGVFGESRLTAVEDRLESLLKKLDDNDKAIESVAHPYMLFKAGSEDSPWEPEKVQQLAKEHEQENYEPGLKQFVQGDIDAEMFSGEVADIDSFLQFDIDWIMSEMPLPKYALGAFESEVNQFVSRSQSARIERQIEEAREEIEDEWTPILEEKVKELDGYSAEDLNGLVIGKHPDEMVPVDGEGNQAAPGEGNIPNGNNSDESNVGPGGEDFKRPPASTETESSGGE